MSLSSLLLLSSSREGFGKGFAALPGYQKQFIGTLAMQEVDNALKKRIATQKLDFNNVKRLSQSFLSRQGEAHKVALSKNVFMDSLSFLPFSSRLGPKMRGFDAFFNVHFTEPVFGMENASLLIENLEAINRLPREQHPKPLLTLIISRDGNDMFYLQQDNLMHGLADSIELDSTAFLELMQR